MTIAVVAAYGVAIVLVAASAVVGRGLLLLVHSRASWTTAAPTGFALLVCICVAVVRLPGHGLTAAATVLALACAAAGVVVRRRARAPDARILIPGAVVGLACSLPFVSNGRFGILGVPVEIDLREHLTWADALQHGIALHDGLVPPGYPLGPHAVAAAVASGLRVTLPTAFTGLLIAVISMLAITASCAFAELRPARRAAASALVGGVLVGAAYLVSADYAWGVFKEPIVGLLLLAFVVRLERRERSPAIAGGVELGVLTAAALATSSAPAGAWFVGTAAAWALLRRLPLPRPAAGVDRGWRWSAFAIAVGVCVLAVAPELRWLARFQVPVAGGFEAQIDPVQALGIWPSYDIRVAPSRGGAATVALLAVGMLFLLGVAVAWWTRRRAFALLGALLTCVASYLYLLRDQNGYVTSKALVIAAPLLLFAICGPLVVGRRDHRPFVRRAAAAVLACLLLGVGYSDATVLRSGYVGPLTLDAELRPVRHIVAGHRVLYLIDDVFFHWKLRGSLNSGPYLAAVNVPVTMRPSKSYVYGQLVDFDSIEPSSLDRFDFALTTRSAFASEPPSNWHPVLTTRSYELWRRSGRTPRRSVPAERGSFGARLACGQTRRQGVAALRTPPVVVAAGDIFSGAGEVRRLRLGVGTWQLSLQYTSPVDVRVRAPGVDARMPATLDQLGPFWRVGAVRGGRVVAVRVTADPEPFLAPRRTAAVAAIAAVRVERPRIVPLSKACGRFVDWYVPALR